MASLCVSTNVRKLLPDVLIDYLWQLVDDEDQIITLEAAELSGRDVQDIICLTGKGSGGCHRVFGVEPVSCRLQVLHNEHSCQMLLA